MKSKKVIEHQPKLGIIDDLINSKKIIDGDNLLKMLIKIINSDFEERLYNAITKNQKYLNDVSNHSYFHNNGFEKYVLDSSEELGIKLRMHVWPKIDVFKKTDIHNHPWQYASYLYKGGYLVEHYELTNKREGMPFYKTNLPTLAAIELNEVNQKPEIYYLKKTISINCVPEVSHYLNINMLHRIFSTNALTVTIVLQGIHQRNQTDTFNENPKDNFKPFQVKRMRPFQIKKRIVQIIGPHVKHSI